MSRPWRVVVDCLVLGAAAALVVLYGWSNWEAALLPAVMAPDDTEQEAQERERWRRLVADASVED